MSYLNHFFSADLALHMKGNQQQAPETLGYGKAGFQCVCMSVRMHAVGALFPVSRLISLLLDKTYRSADFVEKVCLISFGFLCLYPDFLTSWWRDYLYL